MFGANRDSVMCMTIEPQTYNDDLRLAHVLADSVDSLTMSRFKALDLEIETKPDLTPVTDADKAAEESIRSQLARVRPRDAVLGEEFGSSGHGSRRWIIDPIDGTKNFVRGVPVWATLIALVDEGVPVVGLVSAPALGKRWWAAEGTGAYMGKSLAAATRIRVSNVAELKDASLSYSSLSGWAERGNRDEFIALTDDVWRTRAYGDFWSYCMVAEGSRGHCLRAGTEPLRHGRPGADRARRPAAASPRSRAPTAPSAATPWPPTPSCTRRFCSA